MDEKGEDLQLDVRAVEEEGALVAVAPRHLPGVFGEEPVFAADAGAADQVNGVVVGGRAI